VQLYDEKVSIIIANKPKPYPTRIKLDFRSGLPIYEQIVEQISQMVAMGALKPGDQLPTVRELAAELRVNFNTVARSYRLLDEAGLISTQQGRGTYILETADSEQIARLPAIALEELTDAYLQQALRLGFSTAEILSVVQRHLSENNQTSF
jgi:GntR family transcriptional regulator